MKQILIRLFLVSFPVLMPTQGFGARLLLNLGSEELVQVGDFPADITVCGYSVPSYIDWDNDDRKDLVVGEGSGSCGYGKVQVYLNVGTVGDPHFQDYFYAQSSGADLTVPAEGCLGCFPQVVYWDMDDRKDLLVGQADGTVKIFLNTATDSDPHFGSPSTLQVGIPWQNPADLDVGYRATPAFADWNTDGLIDLVVGAFDGKIHLYINCGCEEPYNPAFYHSPVEGEFAQEDGADMIVPYLRSSPVFLDLDNDGRKDLLTGDTEGQLLFYSNMGTEENPAFAGYSLVKSAGIAINLPGAPRSRPHVCDWTGDGYLDVLMGAGDGKVHLYQGVPFGDINFDGDVDFADFAILAAAWWTEPSDPNWNGLCDISETTDEIVDEYDLTVITENWLAE